MFTYYEHSFIKRIAKKKYSKTCEKIKILYKIKKRVQFTCSLGWEVLFTKMLTLTAQKTIPVPAIQKASFYNCTQLAVLAVLRACCSCCSRSQLFPISRKLSFLLLRKLAVLAAQQCLLVFLFWLYGQPPFLAVQKFSCSGCQESLLFRLPRKLPVVAVQKASCCGYLFRKLPVLAILKASLSGCHVSMSSSFFQKAYSPDTWRPGP